MQFKEVVGSRRSIRFFQPWHPVERGKIQTILEAAYLIPRVLEVDFLRAIVVYRDQLSQEELESLKTPTTTAQLDMAPVYIFFYADLEELEKVKDGRNLRELIRLGGLSASHGWTDDYVNRVAVPRVFEPLLNDKDQVSLVFRRPDAPVEGPTFSRSVLSLGRTAIGMAQDHALLCAFDEGLGAQLSGVSFALAKPLLGVPDTWLPSSPMLLGYPAESIEAGGQRPREPFEEDFFEGRYGIPFQREPAVVERLTAERMFQEPAPLPWRWDELHGLARMFGLPE